MLNKAVSEWWYPYTWNMYGFVLILFSQQLAIHWFKFGFLLMQVKKKKTVSSWLHRKFNVKKTQIFGHFMTVVDIKSYSTKKKKQFKF